MNSFRRELFILNCFFRLLRRNFRKYFTVAGTTYFLGFSGRFPAAKPSYYFCRYIDDLADGDTPVPHGQRFEALINRLIYLVDQPEEKSDEVIDWVLADAIKKLQKASGENSLIRKELKHFLHSMLRDHDRRLMHLVLTQDQINQLYEQSFSSVLHLALLGLKTPLNQNAVRLLGLVQGKIYALQDVYDDLSCGIINVPSQVVNSSKLSLAEVIEQPEVLLETAAFEEWRNEELAFCREVIDQLLDMDEAPKSMKMVRLLVSPLNKYVSSELTHSSEPAYQPH